MRTHDYVCERCTYTREEYFDDSEEVPDYLTEKCPKCGADLLKAFTPKNNPQRWRHND
jgi:ssDNA-binding Zn-finger/Zn-ribbon topoisomerase 1